VNVAGVEKFPTGRAYANTICAPVASAVTDGAVRSVPPAPVAVAAIAGAPHPTRTGVFLPIFPYREDSGLFGENVPSVDLNTSSHVDGSTPESVSPDQPRSIRIPDSVSTDAVTLFHLESYQRSTLVGRNVTRTPFQRCRR
jgi:hypothetical protein